MANSTISKEQTEFIKGVGILLIALHNYFHFVAPNPGENEFIFNDQFVRNFFDIISSSALEIINALFSYLGHYGVQLFIFISGYGLAKSYQRKSQRFGTFMKKRVYKLYPAFLIAIGVLFLYNIFAYSYFPDMKWFGRITGKLLMVHTLVPNQALTINGPWWFYGLIMQLYVLFIPMFHLIRKYRFKGFLLLLALSYLLIFLLYTPLREVHIFVMANAPGHIPEFALGILLALYPKLNISKWVLPVLLAVFIMGNYYFSFFPFTFLIITYFLITGISLFKSKTPQFIKFYGRISMYLFATHGFMREPYFANWARDYNNPFMTLLIGLGFLLTVTIVAVLCEKIHLLLINSFTKSRGLV